LRCFFVSGAVVSDANRIRTDAIVARPLVASECTTGLVAQRTTTPDDPLAFTDSVCRWEGASDGCERSPTCDTCLLPGIAGAHRITSKGNVMEEHCSATSGDRAARGGDDPCRPVLILSTFPTVVEGLAVLLRSEGNTRVEWGGSAINAPTDLPPVSAAIVHMRGLIPTVDLSGRLEKAAGRRVVALCEDGSPSQLQAALQVGASSMVTVACERGDLLMALRAAWAGGIYFSRRVHDGMKLRLSAAGRFPSVELLSGREKSVLTLLASNLTSRQCATELSLSVKTIETYRARIMKKLELKDASQLVECARLSSVSAALR